MNVLKWIGSILLAILLLIVVIGVYAFIQFIAWALVALVVIVLTAYGIRAYFKGRPRKS